MKILVFSPGYPDGKKSEYPFVKQLVDGWAMQGHTCTVISIYSITNNRSFSKYRTVNYFEGGGSVTIIRPNIMTFSNYRLFNICLTELFRSWGIRRAVRSLKEKPDVVYCHFWSSGYNAYEYAKGNELPLFVATGESVIKLLFDCSPNKKDFYDYVKGVVCVSTKNLEESVELGITVRDKCGVFPNAINNKLFRKLDKQEMRSKLGLPREAYIVVFVGTYKPSKGPDRLAAAISSIKGQPVYSLFIGSGNIQFDCKNILYKGRLMHEQIPEYLNAADVFVLPTKAEGCCNAIIEAMACGLPIISSNLPFNWDVLNEKNSIMVDPENIVEIATAIEKLRDDIQLRNRMSEEALKSAQELTINKRANRIIDFMERKCKE